MIRFHANSEITGAYIERPFIRQAPSLDRKLAVSAQVQDEIGHGQLLYRAAENLGVKTRERAFALGEPGDLSERERAAVETCLRALADDEFVLAVANIAQDELGHARLWYDLLAGFGHAEPDLIRERDPADFRHATPVERPFERGDWADAVVRGFCYDEFEALRLDALTDTEYPRIADRVGKVRGEESYHRQHARNWLERLTGDGSPPSTPGDGTARERVQAALDRLFPHALTLFEPTDREADVVDLGVRPTPLSALRRDWLAEVVPFLTGLGLTLPLAPDADDAAIDALLPPERGRDGSHTDACFDPYDEASFTYRQLDREEAPRSMADPDDATEGGGPP